MNEIAQLNIEFSIETYFLYDISMIYSFMEAGQLLGVGQELKYEDWVRLLSYIKYNAWLISACRATLTSTA